MTKWYAMGAPSSWFRPAAWYSGRAATATRSSSAAAATRSGGRCPRGTPDPGETREQTALREVREETGLDVQIVRQLDSIQYWFLRSSDGARCHKTVHYYLMAPTGGDTSRHDDEFDFVEWFPLPQAIEAMTYPNEGQDC